MPALSRNGSPALQPRRSNKLRGAAAAFGVGTMLALSPYVWAEAAPNTASPASTAAAPSVTVPSTMTAPVALVQQQSFAPLVKQVQPAVVNISVTQKAEAADQAADDSDEGPSPGMPGGAPFDEFLRRFFEQHGGGNGGGGEEGGGPMQRRVVPGNPGGPKRIALGSGFIVDPSGYVVTNNHVVGSADKVEVILQDNSKYTAKIVGRDPKTDLALLKISADHALPYVSFGDSGTAQVGDWVMAVGNPFGLGGTVTTGIISARGRDIHSGPFDDFLQIDAPINRGNSGGPTFNLNGQVIGINTAIYSPNGGSVGIGFAVPSNLAKTIVAQLKDHGKIDRGWLGVQIQEVTPAIAASLGIKGEDHGALVADVAANSPGAKAGLKQGDVILTYDGQGVEKLRDLPRLVAQTAAGKAVPVGIWRDGKRVELQATVGELTDKAETQLASAGGGQEQQSRAEALGLHMAPLSAQARRELQVPKEVQGVIVSRVDGGSVADDLGIARGDVIQAINQQPMRSPQEAAQKLKDIAGSPQKNALILINRHGVTQYIGVDLGNNQG